VKLICISDTHGDHERIELPAGDVLIHAGDLSAHGTDLETLEFMRWFGDQDFKHRICIAGNHDTFMEQDPKLAKMYAEENGVNLLCDSGLVVDDIQFWGSPITPRFFNWAFMRDPGESIEKHWRMIPDNTGVLITHGPPFGIMDEVQRDNGTVEHTGCPSLLQRVDKLRPAHHIFGHIHEGHGQWVTPDTTYHNVSSMNEHYQMKHDAVTIDINPSQ